MPVLRDWNLELTSDNVLWAQGSDPAVIKSRSPHVARLAEEALTEGLALLDPVVGYEIFEVHELNHHKLKLCGGVLKGELIFEHLGSANQVAVIACTIGDALEKHAANVMVDNPTYGLALYGLGSAAVDVLGKLACEFISAQSNCPESTIPVCPGLVGWPVKAGQQQIDKLLDLASIGIDLKPTGMMSPVKSSTMVVGFGTDVTKVESTCHYCGIKDRCQHRDRAPVE